MRSVSSSVLFGIAAEPLDSLRLAAKAGPRRRSCAKNPNPDVSEPDLKRDERIDMKTSAVVVAVMSVSAVAFLVPACGSSTNASDGGPPDTGPGKEAGMDAAKEAGCSGFEAAAAMFMASAECTSCVETKCTAVAEACACDENCIKIIQCQIACVGDGGSGESCAISCINKSTDTAAGTEATKFDEDCLAPGTPCASVCVTSAKAGDGGDASSD
jgi:hypothetical protein